MTVTSGPSMSSSTRHVPERELSIAAADRFLQLLGRAHEREPALALPIWRLQHAWVADLGRRRSGGRDVRGDRRSRLCDARLGEPLPLPDLGHGEGGGLGRDRVREPEPSCEPGRDRHRPVDSRCHDAMRKLGASEAIESFLVLGRDDGAAIGVGEAGRRGVAIARDHEEPALAGGGEQPELGGPGAEDKKAGRHGESERGGCSECSPGYHRASGCNDPAHPGGGPYARDRAAR